MTIISRRGLVAAATAAGLALAAHSAAFAESVKVNVGYQTGVDPTKVPQAEGAYDKATGASFDWRKFDTGPDVVAALASGAIDIGDLGSSPFAAAASRQLPIKAFYVITLIGESEELVVRNGSGIEKPEDLIGKKVGTPFVSTSHYSLLAALKHWGIDDKKVQILNLRPPELAAAWARGDIDAGYTWDPALGKIKENGKVLVSSAEVGKWGSPTFDVWIVRDEFAQKHPEILKQFAKVTGAAYAEYRANPDKWDVKSKEAQEIARLTGAKIEEVPGLLKSNVLPTLPEQASKDLLGGGLVKYVADTAAFLKEQGKIPSVLADYSPYVTAQYVTEAQASN